MRRAGWFVAAALVTSLLGLGLSPGLLRGTASPEPRQALVPAPSSRHSAAVVDTLEFDYFRSRVEPILLRDRGGFGPGVSACVTCHIRSATPMPLEPLNVATDGSAFWTEEQSRRNFATVAALIVAGSPERSRLLREPLAAEAGGSQFHSGGKFWQTTADPEWQVLADWVRAATALPAGTTSSTSLDFEFFRTCVQRIFLDKRPGKMECVNCHSSGTRNFAREIPDGRAFWNEEESRANFGVVRRYVEPGYPLRSRLLTHPLHPDAGGDHFHGGGRRWDTQDDPEWQMLARWVSGASPTCVL
jgi:hypothetical protein